LRPAVAASRRRFGERRRIWREMLDSEALSLVRSSKPEAARELLRSILERNTNDESR
jgi:hypothetical protein